MQAIEKPAVGYSLKPAVHAFVRGYRCFLVNRDTLGWAALPLHAAEALRLVDGRPLEEMARAWSIPGMSCETFLEALRGADLLEGPGAEPRSSVPTPQMGLTYVLKLTEDCNLRCHYCYAEGGFGKGRMSLDVLKRSVEHAFSVSKAVMFHFHGGEPTLNWDVLVRGAEYIRERQAKNGALVSLSLTTNGLSMTQERLDVLAGLGMGIRLSFDGTAELNDLHRVNVAGKPVSGAVLRTLEMFRGRPGLAWSVLATITREASGRLVEISRNFQEMGVPSVGFIPCRAQGYAEGQRDLNVDPEVYIGGLKDVVGLIERGELTTLRMENIVKLLAHLLTKGLESPSLQGARCGAGKNMLVADVAGHLSACDNIPKGAFPSLGNVMHEGGVKRTFDETIMGASLEKAPECRTCPWFKPCRGGCPGAALANYGNFNQRDLLACQTSLELYPFLLERLAESRVLSEYFDRHYSNVEYRWVGETESAVLR